jgi:hypothetical protein
MDLIKKKSKPSPNLFKSYESNIFLDQNSLFDNLFKYTTIFLKGQSLDQETILIAWSQELNSINSISHPFFFVFFF